MDEQYQYKKKEYGWKSDRAEKELVQRLRLSARWIAYNGALSAAPAITAHSKPRRMKQLSARGRSFRRSVFVYIHVSGSYNPYYVDVYQWPKIYSAALH